MEKYRDVQMRLQQWLINRGVYQRSISKKIFAFLLRIDINSVTDLVGRDGFTIIFTHRYVFKMQLYGNNIQLDLDNRNRFPKQLRSLLAPVKICNKHPLTVRMPLLKQSMENDEAANCILNELRKTGHETEFRWSDYPLLVEGCNILKKSTYGEQANKNVRKYLKENTPIVRVGIVHGDFHRGNILYKNNRPLLIDFDCFRENDIQAVDALYYVLEEERHKHGYKNPWLVEWRLLYDNSQVIYEYKCAEQIDVDLKFGLIILLLERLVQAQNADDKFTERNKAVLRRINRLFSIYV